MTENKLPGKILSRLLFFLLSGVCALASADSGAPAPSPYADAEISVSTIPSRNNTYGYDILVSGKPLIHQPTIPALPGNEGFKTEEAARKVGELVKRKLQANEIPPTVTTSELDALGVRH